MKFTKLRNKLIENFAEMTKDATCLFEVDVDKDEMWNLYLDSFPMNENKILRQRREYDCSCCRRFIKEIGNVVVIKENQVRTIWEFQSQDSTYQPVLDALDTFVKSHAVSDVYVSELKKIGTLKNYEELKDCQMYKWSHFYLELPDKFVEKRRDSKGWIQGDFRDTRNVFKRSLDEITLEALDTILELIYSNTLYKGEEWKTALIDFRKYKKEYDKLETEVEKEHFAWEQSVKVDVVVGRIRNHSIGTLLVHISEGMELDMAVRKYEELTAPSNYKRSKPIYSKRMLEEAQKKITELGYLDSLGRRYATLDDITVNNILFSNKDAGKRIFGAENIFEEMKRDIPGNPKKFSKVEEVTIDKFLTDILPTVSEVELYLDNKLTSNMVSLIAPKERNSKTMFKWNNNFGWAYSGNMTDSMMKERVKAAGGKVDGDLRFSIQWNDTVEYSQNDLDAHCKEPSGEEIFFGNKKSKTQGMLDVDIIHPKKNVPAVENITWVDRKTMTPGTYYFFVHQFSNRGGRDGFRAEIEFDGQIYAFDYAKELRQDENVPVAEVTLDANGNFSIKKLLQENTDSKEVWNIKTNQFIPVSVICYSPNWWDNQLGIGHKHVFFMLKDCINPEQPNGFYNEFLNYELYEHRKVMEALGAKLRVEDTDDQLSGVGFSATKRNEVVLKLKGNTERMMKIKF